MTKWKLVPVDPTPEMIDAWNNDDSDEFRHAYKAMLEAAPQPEPLSDERIMELVQQHNYESGRFYLPDGSRIVDFIRAIEREILGGAQA